MLVLRENRLGLYVALAVHYTTDKLFRLLSNREKESYLSFLYLQ
jgi:hypothetical protein